MNTNELKSLSTEELKKLKEEKKLQSSKHDLAQKTMKITLNALYGCMGNEHFVFYETAMAEAITVSGQYLIRKVADDMNDWLNEVVGSENVDYRVAGDTDSCVGSTLVYCNGKKLTIEEIYNSVNKEFIVRDELNRNYVKPVHDINTLSFNTYNEIVEEKPIKYIMKHRINKEMFRIEVGDKMVEVTEDHSVIICRDGEYISVTPKEILDDDCIITI